MRYVEIDTKKLDEELKEKIIIISKKVKRIRKEKSFTQVMLAFNSLTDPSTISEIERGCIKNITLNTLLRVSQALEVNLEYLLER